MREAPKCCLCGEPCEPWHPGSTGYGHNPEPLGNRSTDRCCMECNETKVIPERMRQAGIRWR